MYAWTSGALCSCSSSLIQNMDASTGKAAQILRGETREAMTPKPRLLSIMDLLPDLLILHEAGWSPGEDSRPVLLRHYLKAHSGTFHDIPPAQEPA